ncbi:MAG: YggS family pyridoxal phosphate-dependent enzyme, partial [Hyphomicrobium sp.]
MSSTPAKQLEGVRARIAAAARSAGRDAADVELIAVSKTFEAPGIL